MQHLSMYPYLRVSLSVETRRVEISLLLSRSKHAMTRSLRAGLSPDNFSESRIYSRVHPLAWPEE